MHAQLIKAMTLYLDMLFSLYNFPRMAAQNGLKFNFVSLCNVAHLIQFIIKLLHVSECRMNLYSWNISAHPLGSTIAAKDSSFNLVTFHVCYGAQNVRCFGKQY